jgi:hypothetical protein
MKKIILIIAFILGITIIDSCKKDEATKIEPISLSTEKSQYAPYEIVIIKPGENIFSAIAQSGKIKGVDVELTIYENTAAFVLPDFENGTYNLTFSLGDKYYEVPVNVTALQNISTADTYFSEMQTNMNDNISDLNDHIAALQTREGNTADVQALQNDLVFFQNQLNSYTSRYNSLSSEEKKVFAKTIAANKTTLDEYNSLTANFNQSASTLTVRDYETEVEISMGKFVASVIYTAGHIPFILAGGKVAAASAGNPGVILALGVVVTSFMVNVVSTATMAQNLTIKSLKPYEFINESGQKVFQKGVETVESAQAKYRSLVNSDGGNSTISTIVETYNSLKDKYNNFRNSLPSILRPSYVIASLKNTFTSTTRSVHNKYINITNVNNPNVTLQKIVQSDGSLTLKATTDATTDQTFTYDVEYTNSNFASNLKKTVNAKVLAIVLNYKLEIGTNNSDYSLIKTIRTLSEGDTFTTPNNISRMVRLTLDDIPVRVGQFGLQWTSLTFGEKPISSTDLVISNYAISVYDRTNLRSVTIPLNVTLINTAYSRIVDKTLTVKYFQNNFLAGTQTISFKKDGTYTKFYSDGTSAGSGNYVFTSVTSPNYTPCSSYIITGDVIGAIHLPGEAQNRFIPNFFIINGDNTIIANSSFGCNDGFERWEIQ